MISLTPGDPAPWFLAKTSANPRYVFSTVAGRYIVLSFLGSAAEQPIAEMLAALGRGRFDDDHASFFAVSNDPSDKTQDRLRDRLPGFRVFWDFDREISRLYGVAEAGGESVTRTSFVLDPSLRVIAVLPITDPGAHARELNALVAGLPPIAKDGGSAPVLLVPRVFEPAFCRELVALYKRQGGTDSGFMRDQEGKTVSIIDYSHKRRRDCVIEDEKVCAAIRARVLRRLVPEITKAFQYRPTRMERYIVACYDAGEGGYFRPHRDNTTHGTAHRRFAVTINLNAEEYAGGELRFPEYGLRTYRAETGGAVVFSCSLLHEATKIESGQRYCTLPFLYDDAAAELRKRNLKFLADDDKRTTLQAALGPPNPEEN